MLDTLLTPWMSQTVDRDLLTRVMLVDVQSYLPGDILTKVDRASMAVSLEARVPLLDHEVVEFALSLPANLTMRDGRGKWLLRKAIDGLVPRSVLERPKQGFGLPLRDWFRRELRHRIDALLRADSPIYGFADLAAVRRVAGEHQSGRRDHSLLMWRLLVLDLWLRALARSKLGHSSGAALASLTDVRVHV